MTQSDTQQVLQKAMVDLREGRLQEAERGYRDILEREPENVDALTMLGMITGQNGHAETAAQLFGKAVSIRPGEFRLYHNLAMSLRQLGRYQDAINAYQRGLQIREDTSLLIPLANLYWLIGKGNDAEDMLLRALKLEPNSVMALHGLGSIYLQIGFHDRAAGALQRAVEINPNMYDAQRDLAVALFQLNQMEQSIEASRKALAGKPNDIVALNHMGMALQRLGRNDEAEEYFARVIALPVAKAEEWFNRGLALTSLYKMQEAEAAYREALRQQPKSVPGLLNLGVTCGLLGRSAEARKYFAEAMKLAPHFDTARLHHAVALLQAGDFEEGWKGYQSRWNVPSHHEPARPFTQAAWRDQRISGKTVLIYGEQGFGDAIQFVRYAPMAAERGGKVILEVRPELVSLMRTVKAVSEVVARGEELPDFDFHAAVLDLPLIFNTKLKNIPASVPYVHPDPAKIKAWSERLAQDEPVGRPALRVGIAWSGSVTHLHDRSRSMNLSDFAPLVEAGGSRVSFVNLQKGPRSEQAANPPAGMKLRDYTNELNDFENTAALLMNLDLIISVDTSVVHLAGALAKPVWTLIAVGPDWRWLAEREDTSWYPTMRLFRQRKWMDWTELMQRVAAALREKLEAQPSK